MIGIWPGHGGAAVIEGHQTHRVIDSGVIRLLPESPSEHSMPADQLAKVISGLQAAIYALGAQYTDPEAIKPGKSRATKQHFQLVVSTPQPGSVLLPVEVRDTRSEASFDDELAPLTVLQDATRLLKGVASRDLDVVRDILPSPVLRRYALREIQSTLPRADEKWTWELGVADTKTTVTTTFADTIEEWLASREDTVHLAVIGQLIRFDFEARQMTIKHPATGRKLSVVYDAAREDALLQQRLHNIQVEGDVILDTHGFPAEIVSVESTRSVDLSPLKIQSVEIEGGRLEPREALEFTPSLDKATSQLYEVTDEVLGIDASSHTREGLIEAIHDEIRFLWLSYAKEDPVRLAPSAQDLAARLRAEFNEVC
jgi:hypothetical protein